MDIIGNLRFLKNHDNTKEITDGNNGCRRNGIVWQQ